MYSQTSVTVRPNEAYQANFCRRAVADAALDHVEVEHQVHRGDHDADQAEHDRERAAVAQARGRPGGTGRRSG